MQIPSLSGRLSRDVVSIRLSRDRVHFTRGNESLELEPTLHVDGSPELPRDGLRLIAGVGSARPALQSVVRIRLFYQDDLPRDVIENKNAYLECFFRFVLELHVGQDVVESSAGYAHSVLRDALIGAGASSVTFV